MEEKGRKEGLRRESSGSFAHSRYGTGHVAARRACADCCTSVLSLKEKRSEAKQSKAKVMASNFKTTSCRVVSCRDRPGPAWKELTAFLLLFYDMFGSEPLEVFSDQ